MVLLGSPHSVPLLGVVAVLLVHVRGAHWQQSVVGLGGLYDARRIGAVIGAVIGRAHAYACLCGKCVGGECVWGGEFVTGCRESVDKGLAASSPGLSYRVTPLPKIRHG